MFYFVLMCIQIYILHFCASEPVDGKCLPGSNEIILLPFDDNPTLELNNKLRRECGSIYEFKSGQMSPGTVSDMIKAVEKYRNVISLNVNDYYDHELYYTPSKGLAYAGDLSLTGPAHYYVSNNTNKKKTIYYNNVKMVSERVTEIDGGHLYNFIMGMDFYDGEATSQGECSSVISNSKLDLVLICFDELDKEEFAKQFCPLRFRFSSNCINDIQVHKTKLLAVLTSKSFVVEEELLSVPTIFYETPFKFEKDVAMFPNSIVTDWKILKYPILKFLENMNCRRVAIITDDSPQNVEFEEELTELLREHVIMYTVKRCEDTNCDNFFKNVLETLIKEDVKMIIANFQEKYMTHLKPRGFRWIVKDGYIPWPQSQYFQFTLAPAGHESEKYTQLGLESVDDKHTRIVENINHVHDAYNHMVSRNDINDINRNKFYRELTSEIKKSMKRMDYVSRVIDGRTKDLLLYMKVTEHGASVVRFSPPKTRIVDVPDCSFKSNDYFNPCNDNELILIMLVVIVFMTSLLLVIIYFHKSSPVHEPCYVPF